MGKWYERLIAFKKHDWFQIAIFPMFILFTYLILFWYYLPYLIEFHQSKNEEFESLYNFYILKSIPITSLYVGSIIAAFVKRELILIRNLGIACLFSKIVLILEQQDLFMVTFFSQFISSGRNSVVAALTFMTISLILMLFQHYARPRKTKGSTT